MILVVGALSCEFCDWLSQAFVGTCTTCHTNGLASGIASHLSETLERSALRLFLT